VLFALHGLTLTAELNWGFSFPALGRQFRVGALDPRGHGGIRPGVPFWLEDCADDAATLVETMGLGPVTAVGYSMGGLVAQLLWRRHPDLVAGLVLCSTVEKVRWPPLAPLLPAWWCPPFLTRPDILGASPIGPIVDPTVRHWAMPEMRRPDPAAVGSAAWATACFGSEAWIRDVNVATPVVMTTLDDVVPLRWQRELAAAIIHPQLFVLFLVEARRWRTGGKTRPQPPTPPPEGARNGPFLGLGAAAFTARQRLHRLVGPPRAASRRPPAPGPPGRGRHRARYEGEPTGRGEERTPTWQDEG
jgi:pimeloyl-ACP methyl ester carboxylesterase